MNRFEDAKKVSKKCIETNPENASGYASYGKISLFEEDFDEAIKFSNKSIELDNKSFYPYMIKGIAQHSLGSFEEALISYKNSIKLKQTFQIFLIISE